jgi:hypothetical protein
MTPGHAILPTGGLAPSTSTPQLAADILASAKNARGDRLVGQR